ncbi:bifunctional glucose-1-phosphatase/inositol phosphatase [Affinibrenneria salicis]|uniref:Bifunctional glucose-1-phosphatase/inositol phosphatase n=1 Tax=Affinibrenneria salicis TaxID=2590031 RepID=A0A5J5FXA3_9GAMM|nr:bifunctional glucose-1-phosphatase/inositol phosphatase [Affinibrenneria salicis]KAA8998578.1 bifunctional glucose-1-phosphatase/inositol phosphatase [Affinibrenneria salicis]
MTQRKKRLFCLSLLPLLLPLTSAALADGDGLTLQQVVVLSRHGLRAPLASPGSALGKLTPEVWPQWDTPASYLTTRGGTMEAFFGRYFNQWLVDNHLLSAGNCPTEKEVYVYANSLQRTIATAQYFSLGAFPGCLVPVHHKEKLGTMDDTFNPIIRDGSAEFKQHAIDSINQTAGENGLRGLNLRLKPIYQQMADIIRYSDSPACKEDKQCDLNALPVEVKITAGQEPGVSGPLKTGTALADAFIMQYYEGAPLKDVAWGRIKDERQFAQLISVKEYYNSVLFSAPVVAKEAAASLVKTLSGSFGDSQPKFTLLVGHDSNVASLFSALGVKPYALPHQFETTPIGGKVVFERWQDKASGQQRLKVEYVYQSTDQIRTLAPLSRANPPQRVTLELKGCPVDAQGFCPFSDFEQIMRGLTQP